MTVRGLLYWLRQCPPDAEVRMYWDGIPSPIDGIGQREGNVVLIGEFRAYDPWQDSEILTKRIKGGE